MLNRSNTNKSESSSSVAVPAPPPYSSSFLLLLQNGMAFHSPPPPEWNGIPFQQAAKLGNLSLQFGNFYDDAPWTETLITHEEYLNTTAAADLSPWAFYVRGWRKDRQL
jgi:hypothetical protein